MLYMYMWWCFTWQAFLSLSPCLETNPTPDKGISQHGEMSIREGRREGKDEGERGGRGRERNRDRQRGRGRERERERERERDLNLQNVLPAFLPVTPPHGVGSSNHMFSHALRWSYKRLLLMVAELVVETLGDNTTPALSLCSYI